MSTASFPEWLTKGRSRRFAIGVGTSSGARGNRRQRNADVAETAVIQSFTVSPFKEWPIGFVEDHPHADHSGTQLSSFCDAQDFNSRIRVTRVRVGQVLQRLARCQKTCSVSRAESLLATWRANCFAHDVPLEPAVQDSSQIAFGMSRVRGLALNSIFPALPRPIGCISDFVAGILQRLVLPQD